MKILVHIIMTLISVNINNNDNVVLNTNIIENKSEKEIVSKVEYIDSEEEYIVPGIGESKNKVSQFSMNLLNREINRLPKNVRDRFVKSGWHIYITDENLSETYFDSKYKNVQGLTNYKKKIILIQNNKKDITSSTVHEMGHYIDYELDYPSYSDEFKKIYDEEVDDFKSNIINSSCVRNPQEFFAEMIYYMQTDETKCTPKAKQYIKKLLNSM